MEALASRDIEAPLQEVEEDSTQESLPPEVEELLHVLQSGELYLARQEAAEQLGKVTMSSARIVRALAAAYKSDAYSMVNRAAANSLRAPVHQEYLQAHPDLLEATESALRQAPGSDAAAPSVARTPSLAETHAKMLKEVRSWGIWLLVTGAVSVILSGLSGSWGVVLLVAGLASFVFREAPMFAVYGIILAWTGISNLLSGQAGWLVFAVVQLVLAFWVFRQYTRYRRAEATLDGSPSPQRAGRAFPPLGCVLGVLAWAGLANVVVGAIVIDATGSVGLAPILGWLGELAVGLAVLGLAVSTASLLSGFRYRVLAILGLVACGALLLLEVASALFA